MATVRYRISDAFGLHARPAARLAAAAAGWGGRATVRVDRGGASVEADDPMALMGLDARCGDVLVVDAPGADARAVSRALGDAFGA